MVQHITLNKNINTNILMHAPIQNARGFKGVSNSNKQPLSYYKNKQIRFPFYLFREWKIEIICTHIQNPTVFGIYYACAPVKSTDVVRGGCVMYERLTWSLAWVRSRISCS